MILRTTSIAELDVVESASWLDEQEPGLGSDFLLAVEEAFAEIKRMPQTCPTLDLSGVYLKSPLRWITAGKFPYLVIFRLKASEAVVVGVLHSHRDLESILRSRVGSA